MKYVHGKFLFVPPFLIQEQLTTHTKKEKQRGKPICSFAKLLTLKPCASSELLLLKISKNLQSYTKGREIFA